MEDLAAAVSRERNSGDLVNLLHQLTLASPDDVSLDELRMDGRRLAIRGTARAPEAWVVELQNHPAFNDVTLLSVVGTERDSFRRFEVRMDYILSSEREEADD
jgi:Tfp pilus assembly protein PilN